MNVYWIQSCPVVNVIGFTAVSLLSYGNLEDSADGFFSGMKPQKNETFKINSKVVTVTVSNRDTSHLEEPVQLTFYHLVGIQFDIKDSAIIIYLCRKILQSIMVCYATAWYNLNIRVPSSQLPRTTSIMKLQKS